MRSKLMNIDLIDEYLNKLTCAVYNARIEKDGLFSWSLFFDELLMSGIVHEYYDTGAIALGIITLCTSKKRDALYKNSIDKACDLLKRLRNEDGSWPATADQSGCQKSGIVYNTVIAMESLLKAGLLELNETGYDKIEYNREFVFQTIEWLFSKRIKKDNTEYYGWGYSGDSQNRIFIMPTVSVLVLLKKVYIEFARRWKSNLQRIIDGKTLLEIINEIQESLNSFRVSPEEGWGKEISEREDRVVYTLYGLYGLSLSCEDLPKDILTPNNGLTELDVHVFSRMICKWNRKRMFSSNYLSSIGPEEYFDSYIQKSSSETTELIDHESFFEAIALISIIEFTRMNIKSIRIAERGQLYQVISNLNDALKNRICTITISNITVNTTFTVVRSRRGLLSQSYPIYAIAQAAIALKAVKDNRDSLKKLTRYRGWKYKLIGFVVQTAALLIVNSVALSNVSVAVLVFVSVIAPISEYIKNWVFKLAKLAEE